MSNTLDILKDIIDHQLNMPPERVWAYNSDMYLPKDDNLFIVLFMTSQKPYTNNSKYISTITGLAEKQTINIVEEILISLNSINTQARDRAYEIPLALNSVYSQELQILNKMHISPLGDIYDASYLEAASRINRFDCKIRVFRAYEKINNIDYYDKFPMEIWTNAQNETIKKTRLTIQGE